MSFVSVLKLDADHTEHGWEIVLRFDSDDCEGAWTGVTDKQLPEIVGPHIAAALIQERDDWSRWP